MTKHKTDNLELVTLDDVEDDAFYPDYVGNMLKINEADKARQAAEAAEATARVAGDTAGSSAVAAEATARAAADSTNAAAIANEATARASGDSTNAAAIAAEAAARTAADTSLATDLAAEVTRATAAEGVNAAAISALGAASPFVCNLVTQYGADPTGVTESVTALQNAVNDAVKFGATFADIYIPKGTYKFDKSGTPYGVNWNGQNTGILQVRGDGMGSTKFTGGTNTRQFLKASGTTSGAYKNLKLWGITWDQNFQAPAGYGNPGGLLAISGPSDIDNIWVEFCEVRNHTVQPSGQPFATCIDMEAYHYVGTSTPCSYTNIHINDNRFGAVGPGGNYQVKIMAYADYAHAPLGWKTFSKNWTTDHYLDEIYVERNYCRAYTTIPTGFVPCSNIIIGNHGHGNKAVVRDNKCLNSGDDGIEVDSMLDTIIENNWLQDCYTVKGGVFLSNLGAMLTPELQHIRLKGNTYISTSATAGTSGLSVMDTDYGAVGHIIMEDERYINTACLVSGNFRSLVIRSLRGVSNRDITPTSSYFAAPNLLFIDQMGGRATIDIDGLYDEKKLTIDNTAAVSCIYMPQPLYLDALTDAQVSIRNVQQRYDIKTIGSVNLRPYTIGSLNQLPNAYVLDNFAANSLGVYYFYSGIPGTDAIVSGGALTAGGTLNTERRAYLFRVPTLTSYELATVGPFTDGGYSIKATPGTTLSGYKAGAIVNGSVDGTNYLDGYVVDNGTNSFLCLDKIVGGTRTSLLGSIVGGAGTVTAITGVTGASDRGIQLSIRIASGTPFWVLTKVRDNTVSCDYFTSALTNSTSVGAVTASATFTTTTDIGQFGQASQGWSGWDWIPQDAAATIDDATYWRMNVFSALFEDCSIEQKGPIGIASGFFISNQSGTTRFRGNGVIVNRLDASRLRGLAGTYNADLNIIDTTVAKNFKVQQLASASPITSGTITAPGSGTAYTNNRAFSIRAQWTGGVLTTPYVEVSNDAGATWRQIWTSAGDGSVFLNPWDQVRWTYSSAPTFTWVSAADLSPNASNPGGVFAGDVGGLALTDYKAQTLVKTAGYTPLAADTGKVIVYNSASAGNITINHTLPDGSLFTIWQKGAGQATIVTNGTSTISSQQAFTKTAGQGAFITVYIDNPSGTAAVAWVQGNGA